MGLGTEWYVKSVGGSEGGMECPLRETLHGGRYYTPRNDPILRNVRLIKQSNVRHLDSLIDAITPATPSVRCLYDDCIFGARNYPCCSGIVPQL